VRRFTGTLRKKSYANIAKSQRRVNVLKLRRKGPGESILAGWYMSARPREL
jgi:hypothetical protein